MKRVIRPRRIRGGYTIQIAVYPVDGDVSLSQVKDWVNEALRRYHTARAGWVGGDMTGRIKCPKVG